MRGTVFTGSGSGGPWEARVQSARLVLLQERGSVADIGTSRWSLPGATNPRGEAPVLSPADLVTPDTRGLSFGTGERGYWVTGDR